MTTALLDFSRQPELALHAQVIGDVIAVAKPAGIEPLIVGAFARDLHLFHAHRIETLRQTEDLDLALAVPDWPTFDALHKRLIETRRFASSAKVHRLRHRNAMPIDLVPFGPIETPERKIVWPPGNEIQMNVFGFREAQEATVGVVLPGGIQARVVSLPALALLKIVCWQDRHYEAPRKDAHDLLLIVENYINAGNMERLFDEFLEWTHDERFDYELSSARMLGHDIRALLDAAGIERVGRLLADQTDEQSAGRLAAEMDSNNQDRARSLLGAILGGMMESRHR